MSWFPWFPWHFLKLYMIKGLTWHTCESTLHDATIVATNKMCNLYLAIALKGHTLICSLGAGHNGVRVSITRNVHIANFIATLNKIKDKTGLYIIVTALNCDWLEYAGGNTTYEDLIVVPNKKTIIPTREAHLNNLWCSEIILVCIFNFSLAVAGEKNTLKIEYLQRWRV